ncbi:BBSome-interacting protein 1 [Drosophila nasuta]|uniref:BBSome-interacting protein 1 n=1 Tax=Drosophila albomicans TaxID=7291 RepID=A0A6P8XN67_DROAB|nr:BBSome-interacting protein 1 [Drosophila albomicans]XP_060648983.1 BBSome-interacting protein 1 [Drosophila nasuta]
MSAIERELLRNVNEKIELIEPSTGKLFFEHKTDLLLAKPRLIPLKSQGLQSLEEMHRETARQLQQKRTNNKNNNNHQGEAKQLDAA